MIEFEGINELLKELEKVEADVKKAKNKALIAGADLLKERTQKAVYSHGLKPRSGRAPGYIDRTSPRNDEIFVGNTIDGFYLYFHELGYWHVRGKRFIPPQPFMSITFEQNIGNILDEYVKVFREELNMH